MSEAEEKDVARQAGRGGLAVAAAKLYFMLFGLVQQIALPRVLGLGGYGALSNVLSAAQIAYNPITATSIQGVSRAVASSPDDEQPAAIRRTLVIHTALTAPLAVAFYLLADPIAHWMGAPHIILGLRIVSGVLLFYGLYTPFIGVLNGQKRFTRQAALDIAYTTLRTAALVGVSWWFMRRWGLGVEGAVTGFVGASALIVLVAGWMVGLGRRGSGGPRLTDHLKFIAPLLVGQVLLNLLLQADLTLLRKFSAESAAAAGLALTAADPLVGAYRATQLFSFLPFQLLFAVTFILFPMLATAARDGDEAAVARYVQTGVRLSLLLVGAMVSVTSGLSAPLLRLVFPAEAAELGGHAMQLLTLGMGAFAIFSMFTTVLNSLKRERAATIVTGVAFVLVVAGCYLGVRGQPFGETLLFRSAIATSSALFLATLVAAVMVKRTARAVVQPASLARVGLATGAAILLGRLLPYHGKALTLGYAGIVALVYLAVLVVTRELGRADLELARTVVSRKNS